MQMVKDAQLKLLLLASLNGNITVEESAVNYRQMLQSDRTHDEKNQIIWMMLRGITLNHKLKAMTHNETTLTVIVRAIADLEMGSPKEITSFIDRLEKTLHRTKAWSRWVMSPHSKTIREMVDQLLEEEGQS